RASHFPCNLLLKMLPASRILRSNASRIASIARPATFAPSQSRLFHATRPAMTVHVVKTADEFRQAVANNKVVIVDSYADWCPPCKAIAPILENADNPSPLRHSNSEEFKDKVHFVKFDVDNVPEIAQQLRVSSIPAFFFFKDGEQVDNFFPQQHHLRVYHAATNLNTTTSTDSKRRKTTAVSLPRAEHTRQPDNMAYNRMSIIPPQQQQQSRSRKKEDDGYAFMRLRDNEIVGCISEIGISFTIADLQKPKPVHVQQIFEWFAELLLNTTRESVDPAMRAAAQDVCGEFADVMAPDTRNLMGFYASLRHLLLECDIVDLSFNDLYKPTYERLVMILSHLINFVRFRESQTAVVDEHYNKSEAIKTRIAALYAENEENEARVEDMRHNRKAMEAQVAEKTARNEELKQRLLELRRNQERVVARLDEAKQRKTELTGVLEQKTQEKHTLRQESAKLRPYVLQSPASLQDHLAELRDILNNDKAHIDALDRR
ncbi:hypothetical protein LLEC1_06976, partial [Akanthomyces lecanii]